MMGQREKLIELITTADDEYVYSDDDKDGTGEIAYIADHLLANGVVVLPCKVGDFVYIPDPEKNVPIRLRVNGISVSVSGKPILRFGGYPFEYVWGDECGKSWYLTEGEANKALDRWKGGDE